MSTLKYYAPSLDVNVYYAIAKILLVELLPTALRNMKMFFLSIGVGLVVHLWLLLFALGSFTVQTFYPIFKTFQLAQWFFRRGNQEPLRAIGAVAAALVFAISAIWKIVQ